MAEPVKINRVSVKGGSVYISTYKHTRGSSSDYHATKSDDLTKVYQERGQSGLDHAILTLVAQGKMKLIGTHGKLREYKEILSNEENLKVLSEAKVDILLDTLEQTEQPTGKTYVIKMKNDILAGVIQYKIGDKVELTPYGTKDLVGAKPRFFILKSQATQYLQTLREGCPDWSSYHLSIEEKKNDEDFTGIRKIANWCQDRKINIKLQNTILTTGDTESVQKIYKFPNRDYKLSVEMTKSNGSKYVFSRRKKVLLETTNQQNILDIMKKYNLK